MSHSSKNWGALQARISMNDTWQRGYDRGYEEGAREGKVPFLACVAILVIGACGGVFLGVLLAQVLAHV